MSDVTRILSAADEGEDGVAERLLPLVYQELKKLAACKLTKEAPGQTLQPTALVHEAYLRLVDTKQTQAWKNRGHFFAAAAEAMRRILIERARCKRQARRGGDCKRVPLFLAEEVSRWTGDDVQDLEEVIELLEAHDHRAAMVVKMRFFAGLTMQETADAMGVSLRTAQRNWTYARAWLHRELSRNAMETGR